MDGMGDYGSKSGISFPPEIGTHVGLNVFSWAAMMFFSARGVKALGARFSLALAREKESKQQEEWHGFKHVYIFYNCLKKYESLYILFSVYHTCFLGTSDLHPKQI